MSGASWTLNPDQGEINITLPALSKIEIDSKHQIDPVMSIASPLEPGF